MEAMLDTGCSRSCISESAPVLKNLPKQKSNVTLLCANNERLSSSQSVHLSLKSGSNEIGEIDAVIVPRLSYPLILGLDIIKELKYSTDSETVCINGQTIPFSSPLSMLCYPTNAITITPHEECFVPVKSSSNIKGTVLFDHLSDQPDTEKLIITPTLTDSSNNRIVCITNKTDTSITLDPNEPLCIASPAEREINAVLEIPNDPQDSQMISEFQAARAIKANEANFIPPISSYGVLVGDQLKQVQDLITHHRLAFAMSDADLGKCGFFRFTLPLIDETDTAHQPPRPVPIGLRQQVNAEVEKWSALGIIQNTQSGFNIPVLVLRKPDKSIRISLDARLLNQKLVPDRFPLPAMSDVFSTISSKLSTSKGCFVSQFDFHRGYWQIIVHPSDSKKLAFSHNRNHYESNRMLYGLQSAPAAFCRIIHRLFGENSSFVAYLDDLLIIDADFDAHIKNIEFLLQTCERYGLLLSAKKVSLFADKIDFLGHHIDKDGIHPLAKHLKNIAHFPRPTSIETLRSFLGMVNYNCKFIPNLALLTSPLNDLLSKKYAKFTWTEEGETAFTKVKNAIMTPKSLAHFNPSLPLVLVNDASGLGVGSVLYQDENGTLAPLGYFSRALRGPDLKRSIRHKELIAISEGIKHFSYYLTGQKFKVVTDHCSLLYLYREHLSSALDVRLTNIFYYLLNFDFEIVHRPGKDEILAGADYLSRLPTTTLNQIEADFRPEVDIPDRLFALDVLPSTDLNSKEDHLQLYLKSLMRTTALKDSSNETAFIKFGELELEKEEFIKRQQNCSSIKNIICKLKMQSKSFLKKFTNSDGVIYRKKENRLLPALPTELAQEFLTYVHSAYGHPGTFQLMKLATRIVYIPCVKEKCQQVCRQCIICLRSKPQHALRPSAVPRKDYPEAPFLKTAIDLYDLGAKDAKGKRYILTCICHLTSFFDGVPLANKTDALVSEALMTLILRHGITGQIHSDNGAEFGPLTKALFKRFNIFHTKTAAYNSRGNGQLERVHREITSKLKILETKRKTWSSNFEFTKFLINNLPKTCNDGLSATECLYGRSLFLPLADIKHQQPSSTDAPYVKALSDYISDLHPSLLAYHINRNQKRVRTNDAAPRLSVGDKCLVWKPKIDQGKLSTCWAGPYEVTRHLSHSSYILLDPENGITYRRNLRHLRPLRTANPLPDKPEAPNSENIKNVETQKIDEFENRETEKNGALPNWLANICTFSN